MRILGISLLAALIGWGCAAGPRISTDIGTQLPSVYGWNIGAADLLDPTTGPCRLGVYLDELTAQGYAKRIRIIYTYEWGPQIRDTWLPVIRAKGYRVLVVLSQHPGDKDVNRLTAWIHEGLPAIADVLDGVHLANEPDGFSGMNPTQYSNWHRQIAQVVRQTLPATPIMSPDFRGVGGWNDWVGRTQLDHGRDYDVVSLHVTHVTGINDLQTYVNDVKRWTGRSASVHLDGRTDGGTDLPDLPLPHIWITEGDWGQRGWFSEHGLPIEQSYIYVYNGQEPESRRTGGESCQAMPSK